MSCHTTWSHSSDKYVVPTPLHPPISRSSPPVGQFCETGRDEVVAATTAAASLASPTKIPGKITVSLGDITINSDFDSGNLAKVEECKGSDGIDMREFDLWTSHDCAGTEFRNSNKSWFYFSVSTPQNYAGNTLRFNIQNLNKQAKLYQQGFTPITKTIPGRGSWERLRSRTEYEVVEGVGLKLSFSITITDFRKQTTYLAFCYPYSYGECQQLLVKLGNQYKSVQLGCNAQNKIYYHRELLCHSLEGRRVDLITVTSWEGISEEREQRLPHLFPDNTIERCHIFKKKKVVFVSSRVHPGESPSSHVLNGLLKFLLCTNDDRAITARKHFVFKLIPMLNPDGVYRGHYRTDTRGANLNRYYLNPDPELHPSIYAARSLIIYYHQKGWDRLATLLTSPSYESTPSCTSMHYSTASMLSTASGLGSSKNRNPLMSSVAIRHPITSFHKPDSLLNRLSSSPYFTTCSGYDDVDVSCDPIATTMGSGLALYIDLHAHATKRGVFMYGNYFNRTCDQAENMLFPRLVSLNSPHLDFEHCLFSESNMYMADKRGKLTREGSGRVAMHKATGIIPCYTLECNYNSGRQCNTISEATLDEGRASPPVPSSPMTHCFNITDFEQVGRSLVVSLLDFFQLNPWTRLPTTSYGSLAGLRLGLVLRLNCTKGPKIVNAASPGVTASQSSQDKTEHGTALQTKSFQSSSDSSVTRRPRMTHLPDMARVCRSKKQQDSQLVAVSISNSKLVSKCEKMFELKAHKQPTLANVTFPAGPTWINGSTTTSKPPDDDLSSPHRYSQFSRSDYFKQGTVLAKRIPSLHILQDLHGTQKTGDPLPVGTPHNSSHIYTRGATNHQLNHLSTSGSSPTSAIITEFLRHKFM